MATNIVTTITTTMRNLWAGGCVKGKESVFSRGEYDNKNNNKKQQHHRREGGGVEEEISVRARKHPEIPTRFFFQILSRCSSRVCVCVPLKREREIEIEKKKKKNSKNGAHQFIFYLSASQSSSSSSTGA